MVIRLLGQSRQVMMAISFNLTPEEERKLAEDAKLTCEFEITASGGGNEPTNN